jgi:radical SAM protein with 4Fe4S-binding SPASM domain
VLFRQTIASHQIHALELMAVVWLTTVSNLIPVLGRISVRSNILAREQTLAVIIIVVRLMIRVLEHHITVVIRMIIVHRITGDSLWLDFMAEFVSNSSGARTFDNVMVRIRGESCVVSSAVAPFVTAYWPELGKLIPELGLTQISVESLQTQSGQENFIAALAKMPGTERFLPGMTGFKCRPEDVQSREWLRKNHCQITFLGDCPEKILLGAFDVIGKRLVANCNINVQFKGWDLLTNWRIGKERLNDVLNYLFFTKPYRGSLMFFSDFKEVPEDLWEYIYQRARIRVGWLAIDFAGCHDIAQFEQHRQENASLKNLEMLANTGLWPHIILPATEVNVRILPELSFALAELTRGGTIEIIPVPLARLAAKIAPPPIEEYIAAVMAIYKDARIPLRMVAPQSWVASRIDADVPQMTSLEAAGASLAVLANGDVYPGESSVGLDDWHLGNVLKDGESLHWERLDAIPEIFSATTKPAECKTCDWRYRCGGVDCSVLLTAERLRSSVSSADETSLFRLYCLPRKALFEESLWDSVINSSQRNTNHPREVIACSKDGIRFQPVPVINHDQNQ